MKIREDLTHIILKAFKDHDFTIKVVLMASLNVMLPLVWPVIGISVLMAINLYTGYQADKRKGEKFKSKGFGKSITKWIEFLLGVIVTVTVDLLAMEMLGVQHNFFTSIYILLMALKELKSISENFYGLTLGTAMKVFIKFIGKKNSTLKDVIKEELEEEKNNEHKRNKDE